MSDKELLELAAKAAGLAPILCYESRRNCLRLGDRENYELWRPLTDDGDALRLALKLKIDMCFDNGGIECVWIDEDISETYRLRENADEEFDGMEAKQAATRRAIVRAAAEIGKEMRA